MSSDKYKFINGKRVSTFKIKECLYCKKEFQPLTSSNNYCSRECYWKNKVGKSNNIKYTPELREKLSISKRGSLNPLKNPINLEKWKRSQHWKKGKDNPKWKGGIEIENGYRIIYCPEHPMSHKGKYKEHRLVMEKELGRYLLSTEIVHHINGDKLDNRIENLVITNRSEHMSTHLHNK